MQVAEIILVLINAVIHAVILAEEEGGEDITDDADIVNTETAAASHAVIHAVTISTMKKMIAAVIHVVTHAVTHAVTPVEILDSEVDLDVETASVVAAAG